MKVEQAETKVFKPVTITLETKEELGALDDISIKLIDELDENVDW